MKPDLSFICKTQTWNSSPLLEMSLQRGSGLPNTGGRDGDTPAVRLPVITEVRTESF